MDEKNKGLGEPKSALSDRELETVAGGVSDEQYYHDHATPMLCWACKRDFRPWSEPQKKDGRCLDCYCNNKTGQTTTTYYTAPPPPRLILIDSFTKKD